jgi:transcriptional regulator with XRE-family HTH domain
VEGHRGEPRAELGRVASKTAGTSERSDYERQYMVDLGRRIRALREERRLTQHAVAERAGVASDMVSRLENGHYTSPGVRTLLRVSEGLGVPVAVMMPDAAYTPMTSEESLARARLAGLTHRLRFQDLDLIADIVNVVVLRAGRTSEGR